MKKTTSHNFIYRRSVSPHRSSCCRPSCGFTIVELLIVIFIGTLITLAVTKLGRDIFFFNGVVQNNANTEFEVRQAYKMMSKEIRSMMPSNSGAYPLVNAASSSIIFFYDVNNDGTRDQVRYYISGTNLIRGDTIPTGTPLSYNTATEATTTLVHNVFNNAANLFTYYDTNYTGTSSALSFPVSISSVRLVKINLIVNPNPTKASSTVTYTTQVSLRNLKDNL